MRPSEKFIALSIKKSELWLLLIAFVLPSLLLYFEVLSRQAFLLTLGGFPTVAMVAYVATGKHSPRQLGTALGLSLDRPLVRASIRNVWPPTLALLLLGGLFLAVLPGVLGRPRSLYLNPSYYGLYFGMTVFQEVMWRGFAFLLLKKAFGNRKRLVIWGSATLFAFSHIYFRSVLILVGTWLLGWLWGKHYWKFNSLSGPIVSHYLVGFPFILLNYMGGNPSWRLF